MRKQTLEVLTATVGEDMSGKALDAWVETHGSGAAAWLLFTYRKQIHAQGFVDFDIKFTDKLPQWFRVAIEKIRRSDRFEVTYHGLAGKDRKWRVRWRGWGWYAGGKARDGVRNHFTGEAAAYQTPGFGHE